MKPLFVAAIAAALVAGVLGGLLRAGVALSPAPGDWLGAAAVHHAFLMVCAFMGTVIGIERAVALKRRWAWSAPAASALSGLALLAGLYAAAGALLLAASLAFTAVNLVLWRRQPAAHTALLVASAACWLAGAAAFLAGAGSQAVVPWWFAFLVVTIAAERLEMTRLTRRHPAAQPALHGVLALLAAGAAASALPGATGGVLYGAALVLLAAWLLAFDIARRTVLAEGLPRYMAVCLLGGYAWLAVAGGAWIAAAQGWPARDTALHALGLGFVFSMMMGHAPVILPAVARVKVLYGAGFYLPLALLHASLLVRLAGGAADPSLRAAGSLGNAAAIVVFAATVAASALAWRRTHR